MATVHVRLGPVMGGGAPVYQKGGRTATITSSGTSQATTIAAAASDFATIQPSGGAIRVAFGSSPTALAGSGDWVLDGDRVDFGPLSEGDKVAIIDLA